MLRPRHAFTLIELLTVIAILGLLMAILFPSLSSARRSAKANACLSTVKSLGTGVVIYLNENRDQFFPFRLKRVRPTDEQLFVNDFQREAPRWQWFIETGMGPVIDPRPFARLGRPFGDQDLFGRAGTTMTIDVFTCPSLGDELFAKDIRDGAFGYNYQYLGNTRQDTAPDRFDNFSVGLHQIKTPSKTVVIADSRGAGRRHGRHSYTLDPPRLALEKGAQRFGPGATDLSEQLDPAVYQYSPAEARHNGRANVLFIDSHAAAMSPGELGYQLGAEDATGSVPADVPIPVADPYSGPYRATNQMWNGQGIDEVANAANEADG